MQHAERPLAPYEAYCFNCKVTFPRETRHCLHCGGRVVSASRKRARSSIDQITKQMARAAQKREQATGTAEPDLGAGGLAAEERLDTRLPSSVPAAPHPNEDIEQETPSRRFSPLTMIWIALAVAGAAIRDCGGG